MPARCSVPNCCCDYDGEEPLPIFKMREEFSDEEKDQWRNFYAEQIFLLSNTYTSVQSISNLGKYCTPVRLAWIYVANFGILIVCIFRPFVTRAVVVQNIDNFLLIDIPQTWSNKRYYSFNYQIALHTFKRLLKNLTVLTLIRKREMVS